MERQNWKFLAFKHHRKNSVAFEPNSKVRLFSSSQKHVYTKIWNVAKFGGILNVFTFMTDLKIFEFVSKICFVAIYAVLSRFTRYCVEKNELKNWRKMTNIRYALNGVWRTKLTRLSHHTKQNFNKKTRLSNSESSAVQERGKNKWRIIYSFFKCIMSQLS